MESNLGLWDMPGSIPCLRYLGPVLEIDLGQAFWSGCSRGCSGPACTVSTQLGPPHPVSGHRKSRSPVYKKRLPRCGPKDEGGLAPWRPTAEAARSRCLAISRIDEPDAIPREMSSRSNRVRAKRERRTAGGIPPRGNNKLRIELCGLSNARPISCSVSPAFHLLQMSLFSIAESPNRFPGFI